MMLIVRFGLVCWIIVRLIFAVGKLRMRFQGTQVTFGGTNILYQILRNKDKVMRICFGIVVPDTVCFVIRKEKYFDRVAKVLGIATEFQTGDRSFDRQAYILCEDQTLLTALAVNKPLRKAVAELIDTGTSNIIRCSGGQLWVECPAKAISSRTVSDHIIVTLLGDDFAPKLASIRDQVTAIRADNWRPARDPHVARERFFYGAAVALAILALATFFWSMGLGFPRSLLFDNAERLAVNTVIVGLLLFVTAAVLLLRGTSRLHLVLLEILLTMAPAAWYIGRTWYAEQNIRQDHSMPNEEMIRVVDRSISSGRRNRKSYYITLERWPDSRIDTKLQVYSSVYWQAIPGQCLRVSYHRGRYGDPWVDSMEPSANCGSSSW